MHATLIAAILAATSSAQPAAPAPGELPRAALERLAALEKSRPSLVTSREIARSAGGRPVTVWTLSAHGKDADAHPSVLLVAGLDADRPAQVAIAADAAAALADAYAGMLDDVTVHVIACANPDALLDGTPRLEGSPSRNARPVDDDRDGTADEDPPSDLDGNGAITRMRQPDPPPGDLPTHAADPAEPRLMRPAQPATGDRAGFRIETEGIDADRDGSIAEDPRGGVDIDLNFPCRWPEFNRAAGAHQLSEPESAAIAEFVLARPRLAGALVLGRWETLARTPDPKPRDVTGKTPMEIEAEDVDAWKSFGEWWKAQAGQARFADADPSGSLALWLYAHRGLPAFSTQCWGRPDVPPLPEGAGTPPASDSPSAKAGKPSDEESAAWLLISDRAHGGAGFLAWTPRAHPTLGAVEIGGFAPGFRTTPPPDAQARIARAVAGFLALMAERRAQVSLDAVTVDPIAPGVRRIRARVRNDGWLPTATAMGRANDAPGPVVVRIDVPLERILSGSRATRIESLPGHGARDIEWVVSGEASEPLHIDLHWQGADPVRAAIRGTDVTIGRAPGGSQSVSRTSPQGGSR